MDQASKFGHIDVLDWWLKTSKEEGLELKYSEYSLVLASYTKSCDKRRILRRFVAGFLLYA